MMHVESEGAVPTSIDAHEAPPARMQCRRCGYDLSGLAQIVEDTGEPVCPECALPIRLSRGPWLGDLTLPSLRRLGRGSRLIGFGCDLISAAALMVFVMMGVGNHYRLDAGSVPLLNSVVIASVVAGWLLGAVGSAMSIVRDPVRGELRGFFLAIWSLATPVALMLWLLIPVLAVALPAAATAQLRYLGRATGGGQDVEWAASLNNWGICGVVIAVFMAIAALPSLGAHSGGGGDAAAVVLLILAATFQSFAWAFRLHGRHIGRLATLVAC